MPILRVKHDFFIKTEKLIEVIFFVAAFNL